MESLIDFANMFLVSNGLFFAALGASETNNDKLKVGLSVAGILVSVFWVICTFDTKIEGQAGNKEYVLIYMPLAFILGWLVSLGIHSYNWWKEASPVT